MVHDDVSGCGVVAVSFAENRGLTEELEYQVVPRNLGQVMHSITGAFVPCVNFPFLIAGVILVVFRPTITIELIKLLLAASGK